MSLYKAELFSQTRKLDDDLDKNPTNPEKWETDIFENDFLPKFKAAAVKDKTGLALREIQRKLIEDEQIFRNHIRTRREQQEKINNVAAFNVAVDKILNEPASTHEQFSQKSREFIGSLMEIYPTQDVPGLTTEGEAIAVYDEKFPSALMKHLLRNPNKDGQIGYWIDHTDEFIETYDLYSIPGRPLLSEEQKAELKKVYQKNLDLNKADQRAAAEALEIEITNDIMKSVNPKLPADQKLTYMEILEKITNAADNGLFVDAAQPRELHRFADSVFSGNDSYKKTQNPKLYWEDYTKAIDNGITEREVRNHVGENGYSVSDYEKIMEVLNGTSGKAKAYENSVAGKELIGLVGTLPFAVENEQEMTNFAQQKAKIYYENAVKENPDWTEMDKRMEALRISRRLRRELESGDLIIEMENKLLNQPVGVALGLQEIWDKLDDESKKAALDLLIKGAKPEQLIAHYKSKKE